MVRCLNRMSDRQLVAAYDWLKSLGRINPGSGCYRPLLNANLIREGGSPHKLKYLLVALSMEINMRIDADEFH